MEYGKWFVSTDEDEYRGAGWDSREEAVAAAPVEFGLSPGSTFWTGQGVRPADRVSGGDFLEMLDAHAMDEGVEGNDGYNVTPEARDELAAFIAEWEKKHDVRPLWFDIVDEEKHIVPGERTPTADASPT